MGHRDKFWQVRWALYAATCALLVIAMLPGLTALAAASPKAKPSFSFAISPKRYGLSVRVTTKPRAVCKLTVSSHKKSATLPKRRTNRSGRVTFTWGVPVNAPSGTWSFSVQCVRAGKTLRLTKRATILTGGNGTDGVIEWDSLSPQAPGKGAGVPVVRVSVPDKRGWPDPGDDYPAALKNPRQDSVQDQWGELNKECTSFVAWALATRNGFNMPFYDDATGWGPDARARGYVVNSTPARGSVAWSPAGHVAYVENVVGGDVQIEEYNHGFPTHPGTYDTRTVPAGNFQYIHFADVGPSSGSGSGGGGATGLPPSPVGYATPVSFVDSSGDLNVFINSGSGINHYVKPPGGGWSGEVIAQGNVGTAAPAAFQAANGDLEVFINSGSGINHYEKAPGGSWGGEIVASGNVGSASPDAFQESTGSFDVFINSGSGINHYVKPPGGGWSGEIVASG